MAIVKYPPNTIHLGGTKVEVNDTPAGAAIAPGMLIERYNSSGVSYWRPHSTLGGAASAIFANNQSMLNKGVNVNASETSEYSAAYDNYAVGDLVEAFVGQKGTTVWARIAYGQNIAVGAKLQSAGDGTLQVLAAGAIIAQALESMNAEAAAQMIRVEIV